MKMLDKQGSRHLGCVRKKVKFSLRRNIGGAFECVQSHLGTCDIQILEDSHLGIPPFHFFINPLLEGLLNHTAHNVENEISRKTFNLWRVWEISHNFRMNFFAKLKR
jgi:hypothetical protein